MAAGRGSKEGRGCSVADWRRLCSAWMVGFSRCRWSVCLRTGQTTSRCRSRTAGRVRELCCSEIRPAASKSSQLSLNHHPPLRRAQVPERIAGIVAADALLIRIHLQHVLRPIRIMLHRGQRLNRLPAPSVNGGCRPATKVRTVPCRIQCYGECYIISRGTQCCLSGGKWSESEVFRGANLLSVECSFARDFSATGFGALARVD